MDVLSRLGRGRSWLGGGQFDSLPEGVQGALRAVARSRVAGRVREVPEAVLEAVGESWVMVPKGKRFVQVAVRREGGSVVAFWF